MQAAAEDEMWSWSQSRMALQVVWSEGKGRHGVATRDVAPGEVKVEGC